MSDGVEFGFTGPGQVNELDSDEPNALHLELTLDRDELAKAALVGLVVWVLMRRSRANT